VKPGDTVLVWGIGGGVASAAVRVAKLAGAFVIATSSSAAKLARARELGADVALDHTAVDVAREVRSLTGKRGADVVIEHVGEATWEQSLRALGRGGRVVTCGGTTGPMLTVDVRRLFWYQWDILGSTMGNAEEYRAIVRLLGQGELRPLVDSVVPLADARQAFERLAAGDRLGKVVVEI
jgi:NADPH:quinone reductase-like Zn-dependent oxidoreductase